jgi:hypothetical protein
MHARIDELLSLRDGAPVDARVRAHADGCAECAAELARTVALRDRLRALPPASDSGADAWPAIQARLMEAPRHGSRWHRAAPFAAAASVAALGLFATLRWVDVPAPRTEAARPPVVLETESLADLRERSQALEALLAAMPERPAVERAGTSVPIESLQAQVQWLDHQLSLAGADGRSAESEQLWRDRVEVMNSLVQLRYVEAQLVAL